ncbi:MAG: sensor histidine kinase [Pigmentiphaga sp.]|nr:sensor histidine kinase [Pigmentiphaga sp.]
MTQRPSADLAQGAGVGRGSRYLAPKALPNPDAGVPAPGSESGAGSALAVACRVLMACLMFIHLLGASPAAAELVLTPEQQWPLSLRDSARHYPDASGTLDFAAVEALARDRPDGFRAAASFPRPLPLRNKVWWLRWDMVNGGAETADFRLLLGSPLLQHVDFYVVTAGEVRHSRAGAATPVSRRLLPSREPTVRFSLEPEAEASVFVRLETERQLQFAPRLYSEEAYAAREVRAALWDAALYGGLLALAWAGLLIAVFSRSWPFAVMGVMCVCIVLFEASYRGYAQLYLWPEALEWGYRAASVFGALSIALLPLFIMGVARHERVELPWKVVLVSLSAAQGVLALLSIWAPYGAIGSLVSLGSNVFMVLALIVAIRLMMQTLMSARLMVLVMAFAVFNIGLRTAEAYGAAPEFIVRWGFDLHPNPVVALIGFALNLAVLSAWVHYLAQQRIRARDTLVEWQQQETTRLETEVARQTEALRQALVYAEEKSRQKAQMLGYISHDLRAPLAAIAGYSQVLPDIPPAEQGRHLKAIDRAVNYQLQLIDELLEYSREDLRPLQIRLENVDLFELLQDVADHAAELAKRQNNHFVFELTRPLPRRVVVDPRRLQQVLLNLLSNAAKFTRGGEIRLRAEGADRQGLVRFAVSDSGIGIDVEHQKNVFQAFLQLQQAHGSVGLGLFIAQRIVDGLGGKLRLDSQPGEGSVFSFELELAVDGDDSVPAGMVQNHRWQAPARSSAAPVPPEAARAELALLARAGRLSDIEDWIAHYGAHDPPWRDYVREVQWALQELDFEAIERAALWDSGHDRREER